MSKKRRFSSALLGVPQPAEPRGRLVRQRAGDCPPYRVHHLCSPEALRINAALDELADAFEDALAVLPISDAKP